MPFFLHLGSCACVLSITCNQTQQTSKQAWKQTHKQIEHVNKQTNEESTLFARDKCRFGFHVRRSIELNYGWHTCQQAKLLKVGLGILCIKTSVNPHEIKSWSNAWLYRQASKCTCVSKKNKHARVQPTHKDHTRGHKASKVINTKGEKACYQHIQG